MAKVPSGVDHIRLPHRLAKLLCQATQNSNLSPAPPQARAGSQLRTADSLKGIAYGSDAAGLGGAQERLEDLREHVGVLMRIEVSDCDSRRLQLADLSSRFAFDLVRRQAAKEGERGKLGDPFAKARRSRSPTSGIEQTVCRCLPHQRRSIDQNDVTANTKSGTSLALVRRLLQMPARRPSA